MIAKPEGKREDRGMASKSAVKRSGVLWLALVVGAALCIQARSGTSATDNDPAKLQSRISDLRSKDSISVVIVGDTGAREFSEVGSAIASYCGEHPCDFGILLGDNFYLRPFMQGPLRAKSRAFEKRFYSPLGALEAGFDVWAVLGNHGYVMWARPQAQIKHTYVRRADGNSAPDWLMPDHVFKIPKLPSWLEIIGFDSQLVLEKPRRRDDHLRRVREAYSNTRGWRVLVGHHPFHTSGKHGAKDGEEQEQLWEHMKALVEENKIQLVLSGHDHHMEFIQTPGFVQVIQGGGSKLRDQVRRSPLRRQAQCKFFSNQNHGFGKATLTEEELMVEYFGVEGGIATPIRSFVCTRNQSEVACTQDLGPSEESGCPGS